MDKETVKGTPVPIDEGLFGLTSDDEPYLIGSKCRSCGEAFFPKRRFCRRCTKEEMEEVAFGCGGKLYSFTTVRVKPGWCITPVPFMAGVVELPEGERIRTQLVDCDQSSLEIGMDMELTIGVVGTNESGSEVLGWKYRPLRRKLR